MHTDRIGNLSLKYLREPQRGIFSRTFSQTALESTKSKFREFQITIQVPALMQENFWAWLLINCMICTQHKRYDKNIFYSIGDFSQKLQCYHLATWRLTKRTYSVNVSERTGKLLLASILLFKTPATRKTLLSSKVKSAYSHCDLIFSFPKVHDVRMIDCPSTQNSRAIVLSALLLALVPWVFCCLLVFIMNWFNWLDRLLKLDILSN